MYLSLSLKFPVGLSVRLKVPRAMAGLGPWAAVSVVPDSSVWGVGAPHSSWVSMLL